MTSTTDFIKRFLTGSFGSPEPITPSRHMVEPDGDQLPETISPAHVAAVISETAETTLKFPYLDDAIRITGQFEGRGFGQITGDFDGQGISAGVLQWNVGTGSLHRVILQPYLDRFGSIDALEIFPKSFGTMNQRFSILAVRDQMLKGTKLKPEWRFAWEKFLTLPAVVQLQREGCYAVAAKAAYLATGFGMDSWKSFCFFFDIVTQNGSMKGVGLSPDRELTDLALGNLVRQHAGKGNRDLWLTLIPSATREQRQLFKMAYDRARLSKPTYFQDVFARKGTIALCRGFVHGRSWDLRPTESGNSGSVPQT